MADFNNKNTNKKSYNNNNNNRPQNKKPYFGDNNKKNFSDNRKFDKDFDDKKSFDTPRKPRTPKTPPVARKPVFRPRGVEAPEFAGEVIEYKMSAALANTILKSDKTKRTPQEVLCEYVNTQCGLKGFCVRVSYF